MDSNKEHILYTADGLPVAGLIDFDAIFPGEKTKELFNAPYQWEILCSEDEALKFFLERNDTALALLISGSFTGLQKTVERLHKFNPLLRIIGWKLKDEAERLSIDNAESVEELGRLLSNIAPMPRLYNRITWPLKSTILREHGEDNIEAITFNLSAGGAILELEKRFDLAVGSSIHLLIMFVSGEMRFRFFAKAGILRIEQREEHYHVVVEFLDVSLSTREMIKEIINAQIYLNMTE
jgi:hypothetical protein